MNRRSFLKSVCGSALVLGLRPVFAVSGQTKPNIILVISDDAGYSDFGFNGGDQIPTPHLDKLAYEGVICNQGYVTASVCGPSRSGLIVGRYQQRFGAECNCAAVPTPGYTKDDFGVDTSECTIADGLKGAGYNTMMIGKWHLGEELQYHPLKRGFDEFYGFLGGSRSYWPIKNPGKGSAMMRDYKALNEQEEIKYTTDDMTDAAIDFIKRKKDKPFFIFLSYNAVHTPMHAKEEDIEQFTEITHKNRRIYAAMTKSMDGNIGRVMKVLKDYNLDDNTMIVFINDNGGPTNNSSINRPLRGYKGSYWEGGIRVPFVIKWPGKLPAGSHYDQPVSTLDLMPMMLAAAGAKHAGKKLDGVNLLPYLRGENKGKPHEYLFWRLWRTAAVRKDDWKLLRIAEDPLSKEKKLLLPLMLFNLKNDPGETTNVADKYPKIAKDLLAALENWEKELAPPRWYDGTNWQHWADMQIKNHRLNGKD